MNTKEIECLTHAAYAAWLLSDHGCKDILELAVKILSNQCYYTERRLEMLGEVKHSLATTIREQQANKELTRHAIMLLETLGENADDLRAEFEEVYGEEV